MDIEIPQPEGFGEKQILKSEKSLFIISDRKKENMMFYTTSAAEQSTIL